MKANTRLLKLAGRVPFSRWKGEVFKGYKNVSTAGIMTDQPVDPLIASGQKMPPFVTQSDPGVVGYPFIPSIGISRDATSAINASMLKEVGEIAENAKVSFISNIDPQDLGDMYIAIESAMLCFNHGARLYSYYKTFNRDNLYQVKGLYKAMHVDYVDILQNIPNLLTKLNWYKNDMDKLYLPKKFSTFEDHFVATGKIFKDCELAKSINIVEYPKGFWKYSPTLPGLVWVEMDNEDLTFNRWCEIMDELLQALIGDEDVANLTAYLKKAYSSDQVWHVNEMDWGSFAETVYDPEEIKALHNACFLNYSSVTNMDIVQVITENVEFRLQWDPVFTVPSLGCNAKRIYDIKSDDPTEDDVIECSKYMFTTEVQTASGNGGTIKLKACSSMIICNPHIVVYNNAMELIEVPLYTEIIPTAYLVDPSAPIDPRRYMGWYIADGYSQVDGFNSMLFMSSYHAAPIVNVFLIADSSAGAQYANKLMIYNALNIRYNHVHVEDEVVTKILEAMIASQWAFDSTSKG